MLNIDISRNRSLLRYTTSNRAYSKLQFLVMQLLAKTASLMISYSSNKPKQCLMLAIFCRAGSPPKYRIRGSYARKRFAKFTNFICAKLLLRYIIVESQIFHPRTFQLIWYLFYIAKRSIFSIRTISLEHVFDAWYLLTALSFHA